VTPEQNAFIFTCLLVIVVLVLWSRIGRNRDMFDELKKLLVRSQGVAIVGEMDELRQQLGEHEDRLTQLENDRKDERRQSLDVNEKVLKAMKSLEERWATQQHELAVSVAAEVRTIYLEDVKRVVTQRFHELNKGG